MTYDDLLAAAAVFHELGIKPISFGAGNLVDMVFFFHGAEFLLQDADFNSGIDTGETTFTEGYLKRLISTAPALPRNSAISPSKIWRPL